MKKLLPLFLFCGLSCLAQTPPAPVWKFAVSGDSRNCGDIVMPAIAASVTKDGASFYWHLGDFRAIYDFDEDMVPPASLQLEVPHLTISSYLAKAWSDFIEHQLRPFGTLELFLGIGNHETIFPQTREAYLAGFESYLNSPRLRAQREQDKDTSGVRQSAWSPGEHEPEEANPQARESDWSVHGVGTEHHHDDHAQTRKYALSKSSVWLVVEEWEFPWESECRATLRCQDTQRDSVRRASHAEQAALSHARRCQHRATQSHPRARRWAVPWSSAFPPLRQQMTTTWCPSNTASTTFSTAVSANAARTHERHPEVESSGVVADRRPGE